MKNFCHVFLYPGALETHNFGKNTNTLFIIFMFDFGIFTFPEKVFLYRVQMVYNFCRNGSYWFKMYSLLCFLVVVFYYKRNDIQEFFMFHVFNVSFIRLLHFKLQSVINPFQVAYFCDFTFTFV